MRGVVANDKGGVEARIDTDVVTLARLIARQDLIGRIVLTRGSKWTEIDAVLHGGPGTILV